VTVLLVVVMIGLTIEVVVSLWCAWWMRQRYGASSVQSILWKRLIELHIRTVVAGFLVLIIVLWTISAYVFEHAFLPRPWGALGLAAALALLFWGPIADWRTLRRLEKGEKP
jgi:hypothetical protein